MMLHAVIMAGGSGTRFWPASRALHPKQLLDLAGSESMIQATVSRLEGLVDLDAVLIVTNQRLVDPIRQQLPQLPAESVLGEPCKRDTAPCVGLAASWVARQDPEAMMVVMPADHLISPPAAFQDAIARAVDLVEQSPSRLVTFGIKPTYPAESFGYIQRGEALAEGAYRVEQFKEKPPADLARQYLKAGTYYWNSGIFVWRAKTILELLAEYEPEMYRRIETIAAAIGSDRFYDVLQSEFAKIQGISVDYAVMERAPEVVVMEATFEWDDVGSWASLARLRGADDQGNTIVGENLAIETFDSIIRSEGDHLIATVGVRDLIIVHTSDATLVANRHDEESVRKVVELLQQQSRKEFL